MHRCYRAAASCRSDTIPVSEDKEALLRMLAQFEVLLMNTEVGVDMTVFFIVAIVSVCFISARSG